MHEAPSPHPSPSWTRRAALGLFSGAALAAVSTAEAAAAGTFLVDDQPGPTTDDRIGQAIAAAAGAGGGIVRFTPGVTYTITKRINLRNNVTLASAEPRALINVSATFDTAATAVIGTPSAGSAIGIEALRINSKSRPIAAIRVLNGTTGVTITGVEVVSNSDTTAGQSVLIESGSDVVIAGCAFRNAYSGVAITGNSRRITITDTELTGIAHVGVYLPGGGTGLPHSEDVTVQRCTVQGMVRRGDGVGHAINCHTGGPQPVGQTWHRNIRVLDCRLLGNKAAFQTTGNADLIEFHDVDGGRVEGTEARDGGDIGISLRRSTGVIVTGNTATGNATVGFGVDECTNIELTDNIAANNNKPYPGRPDSAQRGGIRIGTSEPTWTDGVKVSGNTCYDSQDGSQPYGIYLEQCRNVELGPNNLAGNTEARLHGEVGVVIIGQDPVPASSPCHGEWEVGAIVRNVGYPGEPPAGWRCVQEGIPGRWEVQAS